MKLVYYKSGSHLTSTAVEVLETQIRSKLKLEPNDGLLIIQVDSGGSDYIEVLKEC